MASPRGRLIPTLDLRPPTLDPPVHMSHLATAAAPLTQLTEEEAMFRDAVREFAEGRIEEFEFTKNRNTYTRVRVRSTSA